MLHKNHHTQNKKQKNRQHPIFFQNLPLTKKPLSSLKMLGPSPVSPFTRNFPHSLSLLATLPSGRSFQERLGAERDQRERERSERERESDQRERVNQKKGKQKQTIKKRKSWFLNLVFSLPLSLVTLDANRSRRRKPAKHKKNGNLKHSSIERVFFCFSLPISSSRSLSPPRKKKEKEKKEISTTTTLPSPSSPAGTAEVPPPPPLSQRSPPSQRAPAWLCSPPCESAAPSSARPDSPSRTRRTSA